MKKGITLRRSLSKLLTRLNKYSFVEEKPSVKDSLTATPSDPAEFYLDETSKFNIQGTPNGVSFPRWMQIAHCEDKRTSLILVAGESLELNSALVIERDTRLFIRYTAALPSISSDGLICTIRFDDADSKYASSTICSLPICGGKQSPYWRVIEFDVSFLADRRGRLVFKCQPGPKGYPTSDWLAIADLSIARTDRLSVLNARSFHEIRSKNEIEHFSSVYRHSMYSSVQDQRAEIASGCTRTVRSLTSTPDVDEELAACSFVDDIELLPGESPYSYASRLLALSIPQAPPNFTERLKSRSESGGVVKVLSLCSGAARIEASFAEILGSNVEWSLLDINVDLLGLASRQFSSTIKLDLIEANVNELKFSGEKWDVILCVSALHHIVELEQVIKFCHESLNKGGEFWSIGEYVGRNGNRLWPEARCAANGVFQLLPERYRLNHHTNHVDQKIPDNDYSVDCFEGIRSEEIESILDRWFHPVDVYRRNCFLWRLVNLAYSDNYDILKPDDRNKIISMVNAEVLHFQAGGRGTELNGVYRPRLMTS
jgi:SAM-dependent methyltransferase